MFPSTGRKTTLEDGWYLIGEENPLNSHETENQGEQKKDNSQASQIDNNNVTDDKDDDDPSQRNEPRYIWKMREVKDCRTELADFAISLQTTISERSKSMPKLNELLSGCLDFGILFDGVCGKKTMEEKCPVNRNEIRSARCCFI